MIFIKCPKISASKYRYSFWPHVINFHHHLVHVQHHISVQNQFLIKIMQVCKNIRSNFERIFPKKCEKLSSVETANCERTKMSGGRFFLALPSNLLHSSCAKHYPTYHSHAHSWQYIFICPRTSSSSSSRLSDSTSILELNGWNPNQGIRKFSSVWFHGHSWQYSSVVRHHQDIH